ncbi:hypothetical protein DAPPUDRAFT_267098 [Daphnia pulex]|uniref:Endonuclease/exonuclease/phosphatase domain-containing protein n=1 Tax=Daphnia pulex TaxID=6669 RepID=E9HVZ3_DAPPU|nr:hypothetical protein DAPPUDRAFT_267098 [Daphnia pulex]|eukprot:EFX64087.1 hypothetical protein DAPPUDRAFT_267098 [Daphnia pulex]
MKVASINIARISTPERLQLLLNYCVSNEFDVICLQEVAFSSCPILESRFQVFASPGPNKAGTAVLVSKTLKVQSHTGGLELVDVWKALRPRDSGHTYFHQGGSARIDRIYCSRSIRQEFTLITTDTTYVTDHAVLHAACSILPASPTVYLEAQYENIVGGCVSSAADDVYSSRRSSPTQIRQRRDLVGLRFKPVLNILAQASGVAAAVAAANAPRRSNIRRVRFEPPNNISSQSRQRFKPEPISLFGEDVRSNHHHVARTRTGRLRWRRQAEWNSGPSQWLLLHRLSPKKAGSTLLKSEPWASWETIPEH